MDGDKTRYAADSTGHITVDNPAHAAQITRNGSRFFHKRLVGFAGPVRRCACGFAPHSFSVHCPRCGRTLKEQ